MNFKKLLGMLMEPPEDGLPENIYSDLGAAYDEDINSRDGQITELTDRVSALQAENDAIAAANFRELLKMGTEPTNSETDNTTSEEDIMPMDDMDLSDLFEDDKENK